jgi:hypothetical protein
LEQFAKLLDGESGVANDAAHGEGIDRVVTRNGKNALSIRHDDVFSLPQNAKSSLLQSAYCVEMGNPWKFSH